MRPGMGALGALRHGLFDRRGNVRFCQVFVADHPRRFGAVAGPDGRLRRIQVDQVLLDEPRLLGRQLPAQATRNAGLVNLHSATGLGHALGSVFTLTRTRRRW